MLKVINAKKSENEIYHQYPGLPTPGEIFGGVWQALFEDEGVFFRTPGGNALAFNSGVQDSSNRSHNHDRGNMEISASFNTVAFNNATNMMSADGSCYVESSFNPYHGGGGGSANAGGRIRFYASRTWTGRTSAEGANEARPKNRTYRIWRKMKEV